MDNALELKMANVLADFLETMEAFSWWMIPPKYPYFRGFQSMRLFVAADAMSSLVPGIL